jgi:branched-chain amino acid transport system permease protein
VGAVWKGHVVNAAKTIKWPAFGAVAVVLLALPYMMSSFWVNMATQALYLGLFALSINLLAGYAGMVTLGQAGISGVAGYTFGILLVHFQVPMWPALGMGLAAALLAAGFFGLLAVRTSGVYFLMVTLAEGMVVWGIAQRWTAVTGGDNGLTGLERPSIALAYWTYYYFTLAVVVFCTTIIALIVRSPFGLSLKGIREAEARMAPLGYNVPLHKLFAFTLAGAFAGVSGLLLAMYNNFFSPVAVHLKASADGLLMSILGGMATITGAFVGSSIYIFITNYVSGFFDRWPTLLGLVFVVAILFARDGIVGAWNRLLWTPLVHKGMGPERAAIRADAALLHEEPREQDRSAPAGPSRATGGTKSRSQT